VYMKGVTRGAQEQCFQVESVSHVASLSLPEQSLSSQARMFLPVGQALVDVAEAADSCVMLSDLNLSSAIHYSTAHSMA